MSNNYQGVLTIITLLSIVCCVKGNTIPENVSSRVQNTTISAFHETEPTTTESNYRKIISGLKGMFKDFYNRHFLDKYQKLEDFFSSSKTVLEGKIEDIQNYIAAVEVSQKELMAKLKNDTKEKAQAVSDALNGWYNDMSEFKSKVVNSAKDEYNDLQEQWRKKLTEKWNNGLEAIIELSKKAEIDEDDQENLIQSLNLTLSDGV